VALDTRAAELDRQLAARRRPRIHAVIVHHRDSPLLEHCLRGLLASRGVDLRVVVVANACEEALPAIAIDEPSILVTRSSTSLGFSAANNLGVTSARAQFGEPEHYLFLNNDVLVEPDTLLRLAEAVEAWPRGGIAGPQLVIWGAEDHLNSLGLNVTLFAEAWDEGIGKSLEEYGPLPATREVLAVTGSAALVRAATLAEIGGWSEVYGYYMEDIDLCLKARGRGWKVVHAANSRAAHAISATSDRVPDFKRYLTWRNQWLLLLVHWPARTLLRQAPLLLGSQLLVFARRLRARAYGDARLQARSWGGAIARLPAALRERRGRRESSWVGFLRPARSVPAIRLPQVATRPWEREATGAAAAATTGEGS
jgi:GT2 family glycosyltransferase